MTLEELRLQRAKLHGARWDETTESEHDAVYALAERYLYLRSGYNDDLPVCDRSGEWIYGEKLDAAIDAEMERW